MQRTPVIKCYGNVPLGYTGEMLTNRLPKQSLVTPPLERRGIQVQTVYICTGRRVTNSRFQFLGTQGEYQIVDMRKITFL